MHMIKSEERVAKPSAANNNSMDSHQQDGQTVSALPKCCCTWKNCRAYQKAFREARHPVYDGVVKIKLIQDHPESMAFKQCIDRTLGVSEARANDWKMKGDIKSVKYVVARHHFTEKHIQKFLQDPKNFSFLKPFSIHGAKKYLYTIDRNETLQTAMSPNSNEPVNESELLYLQCPNVPKEAVKQEFYKVMEKVKRNKIQQQQEKVSNGDKKKYSSSQQRDADSVASTLHQREAENKVLKEQLDAMKSQLTFLHDMVQKLQEQHFDHQSVAKSTRSRGRRASSRIPETIELGDDDNNEEETYWNEEPTDGDWTDNSDEDEDDEQTSNTFQVSYKADRRGSSGDTVYSKAASTIVSASKSVKTLPREIELDKDDSDSHDSLEQEAFENRSFASSHFSGRSNGRRGSRASFVGHRNGPPTAMSGGKRQSLGPSSKKPNRRVSGSEQGRQSLASSMSRSTSSDGGGSYEVTAMVVTDPYGEKGSYTGSISTSTGMPNGYGRLEYDKAGRWYEGDWKHGRWTGRGRLSNGDGDFYEGGLKNDHKHGKGIMKFADGRTFEGEYLNGQMVEGKMTYQDGSTYTGSWVDGMRHGRGRCVFTDESVYDGEFKEGEFFGNGKMTWNDGGWYEGEWLNGDMHGIGREVRADGSLRHDGEWIKGQPIRKNRK